MSAQKPPRRGVFSALAGLLGFSALAGLLVTVMVAPAIAVTGVTASTGINIFDDLPEHLEIGQQPERNEIWGTYRGDGNVGGYGKIATIFNQNREEIGYDQISQFALDAATDGEDRRFFDHGGVDVASVVRAAAGNLISSDIESGASTLTMQLVKNIFVMEALNEPTAEEREAAYDAANAQTIDRKLSEMKYAINLEKNYTKKEILAAYLNIAFFGDNTYGIQAAAQRYYSVDAADLTLPQAASLVAIVQEPSNRALDDPENYLENQDRRDVILTAMFRADNITREEFDAALATPVDDSTLAPSPAKNGCIAAFEYARWFCDYVIQSVGDFEFLGATPEERETNWSRGGYTLYTTLDLDVQIVAQQATWAYAPAEETAFNLGSATSTVQAGTGRVLVMTENKYFDNTLESGGASSAVNYNTSYDYGGSSGIQPGSTYKTFTLIEWLKQGKGVNERVNGNSRQVNLSSFSDRCNGPHGGTWKPANASNESGNFTVRSGTVQSINGVFVSMAQQLDLCDIRDGAASLGVERADGNELNTNPGAILGTNEVTPLSMAGAYAAIAAGGNYCKPIIVDRVIMPNGDEAVGQTPQCTQAIDPDIAATVIDVLDEVPNVSNTRFANPNDGIPIFGKTGTTDFSNQTWMASATSVAGTAVWVGNSIGEYDVTDYAANGEPGILLRHYITRDTMATLNSFYGGAAFPEPSGRLLNGTGVAVPDLRGQTADQAKQMLEGLGFSWIDGGAIDSELPEGVVSATNPAAGTLSARGTEITFNTSRGNRALMPDVVGDGQSTNFNSARSQLQSAGLSAQQVCSAVPAGDPRIGFVTASDPAAGALVTPGATVRLTVAQGSPCAP